jgi:hypothetical protein
MTKPHIDRWAILFENPGAQANSGDVASKLIGPFTSEEAADSYIAIHHEPAPWTATVHVLLEVP